MRRCTLFAVGAAVTLLSGCSLISGGTAQKLPLSFEVTGEEQTFHLDGALVTIPADLATKGTTGELSAPSDSLAPGWHSDALLMHLTLDGGATGNEATIHFDLPQDATGAFVQVISNGEPDYLPVDATAQVIDVPIHAGQTAGVVRINQEQVLAAAQEQVRLDNQASKAPDCEGKQADFGGTQVRVQSTPEAWLCAQNVDGDLLLRAVAKAAGTIEFSVDEDSALAWAHSPATVGAQVQYPGPYLTTKQLPTGQFVAMVDSALRGATESLGLALSKPVDLEALSCLPDLDSPQIGEQEITTVRDCLNQSYSTPAPVLDAVWEALEDLLAGYAQNLSASAGVKASQTQVEVVLPPEPGVFSAGGATCRFSGHSPYGEVGEYTECWIPSPSYPGVGWMGEEVTCSDGVLKYEALLDSEYHFVCADDMPLWSTELTHGMNEAFRSYECELIAGSLACSMPYGPDGSYHIHASEQQFALFIEDSQGRSTLLELGK